MPTQCITIDLAKQGRRQVRASFDGGRMSCDGGALLLQAVDQRLGLTQRLAGCFRDHRDHRRCEHSLQRLFGLALGYADVNDEVATVSWTLRCAVGAATLERAAP